jgi:hypothetical protein
VTDDTCIAPHRHDPDRPRRAVDGLRLCPGHLEGLRRDLRELPRMHTELVGRLLEVGDQVGRTGRGDAVGIALSDTVVRTRDHIRATLVSWAQVALEEGPWEVAPPNDLATIGAWLDDRAEWFAAREWADEIVRNLTETIAEARAALHPNSVYRVELGPCPEVAGEDQERCPGMVIAFMRRQDDVLPSVVRCTERGDQGEDEPHAWTADRWHALGRRMGRDLHPEAAAALLAAITTRQA